MTSFAVNYGWTPEKIAQDKSLKEKNGSSAHITPAKTYVVVEKSDYDSAEIGTKKSDKKVASPVIKGLAALYATGVIGRAIRLFSIKEIEEFVTPIIKKGKLPNGRTVTRALDNGKPLKWLRVGLIKADKKLVKLLSKLSQSVQNYKNMSIPSRISANVHNFATCAGIGLFAYGSYQLIKGIANAISNESNK